MSGLPGLTVEHPALAGLAPALRAAFAQRAAGGELALPVLPHVAMEVLSLAESTTSDAAQLSTLIHRDQALAAHLLRIVNSAAYQGRAPIVSLQQAVARLGVRVLAEIVLAASLKASIFRAPGTDAARFEAGLRAQWHHAALAGAFAKELARAGRRNVEAAFLCGLLHDIGRPVLWTSLAELARGLNVAVDADALDAVADGLHAELGGSLARAWNLPEATALAVTYHHAPDAAPSAHELVRTTTVSDHLAHWAADGHPSTGVALDEAAVRALPQLAQLNLYPEMVDALFAHKARALAFAEALA